MNSQQIDFSSLKHFTFEISSNENFETITEWMERRFIGLPLFHKSVKLKVKHFEKIIEGRSGKLEASNSLNKRIAPHLKNSLKQLLYHMNLKEGIKTFGLLHLSVSLMPHLLDKEFIRYENYGRPVPNMVKKLSKYIEVPIVLAIASRKTSTYYESLATGIRGVGNYCSVLSLSNTKQKYTVHAGLEASVGLEHIDHILCRLSNRLECQLISDNFLNRYLKNYLIPEREDIVKKLCHYVFNGCNQCNDILIDSISTYQIAPKYNQNPRINVY